MFYVIVAVHFFLCALLIGLVLVQQGKGADMGATFGSGGANTLFGAAGAAPFIVKLTTGVCILFMVTSILLIKNYSSYTANMAPTDALQGSIFDAASPEASSPETAASGTEATGAESPGVVSPSTAGAPDKSPPVNADAAAPAQQSGSANP